MRRQLRARDHTVWLTHGISMAGACADAAIQAHCAPGDGWPFNVHLCCWDCWFTTVPQPPPHPPTGSLRTCSSTHTHVLPRGRALSSHRKTTDDQKWGGKISTITGAIRTHFTHHFCYLSHAPCSFYTATFLLNAPGSSCGKKKPYKLNIRRRKNNFLGPQKSLHMDL